MSIVLNQEKYHYGYNKVRFLEREHGIEYIPFELNQIKNFHNAKQSEGKIEVTGYISWSRSPYFLLLPTKTTPTCYFVCKIDNGINYPSLNQFSMVSGKWVFEIIRDKPQKILLVNNIQKSDPDFGNIKPDISYNDFIGTIFENWRNMGDTTQKLIGQKLVSSPTIINQRSGGLTLTLANFSKKRKLNTFVNDIDRFIPDEIAKQKSLSFKVEELGISSTLPDLGSSSYASHLSAIPKTLDAKLDRVPSSSDEYSITLMEETMGALDYNSRGLVKSDYPIIIEQEIERKSVSYDVSLDVFKYLMVTDFCSPVVSVNTFQQSLDYGRGKLLNFVKSNPDLSALMGNNQFLDLGGKGKPLSIHNLAVSFKRAIVGNSLSIDDVQTTTNFYFENLQYVMEVQNDLQYQKISPKSTVSVDERKFYTYIENNNKVTVNDIASNFSISLKEVEKIIRSLYAKHLIYEPVSGYYSAVPI